MDPPNPNDARPPRAPRAPDAMLALPAAHAPRLAPKIAAWLTLGLWLPYAALNLAFPGPALTYALGMALALLSLGILLLAGATPRDLLLHLALPSRRGLLLLGVLALFIPAALLAGRGQPFSWLDDLIYAPASGIAQELYFRSALFFALTTLCHGRGQLALVGQALLFAIWHARAFRVVAPAPALAVLALTFVAGLLWGAQARRDGTFVYAAAEHTLFLIIQ